MIYWFDAKETKVENNFDSFSNKNYGSKWNFKKTIHLVIEMYKKEEMCSEIAYVRNISSCVIFPPLNPADTIHFHPSKKSI